MPTQNDLSRSFSMFLSSREAANDFHMDKFTIEGAELLASSRNLGYSVYDLQIYKHLYLGIFGSDRSPRSQDVRACVRAFVI